MRVIGYSLAEIWWRMAIRVEKETQRHGTSVQSENMETVELSEYTKKLKLINKRDRTDQIVLEAGLNVRGPSNPCKHGKPSRQDDNYNVCTVAWRSSESAPVNTSI